MMDQEHPAMRQNQDPIWGDAQQQIRQELGRLRTVRASGVVPEIVLGLQRVARLLRHHDRPYQALRYIEEARELLAGHPDDRVLAFVLADLGSIQFDELVDMEAAAATYRASLAIATRERQPDAIALALLGDAAVRIILGDTDLALRRITAAHASAEVAGRRILMAPIHNLLAIVHALTDRQKGLEHCHIAHDFRESDDYVGRATDLNNIALMLAASADITAAERAHQAAFDTFDRAPEVEKLRYDYLRRQLQGSLADFHVKQGQPEEALVLLQGATSMREFSRPKMRRPLSYIHLTKGHAHVMMGDGGKATAAAEKALRCAVSVRDTQLIAEAYRLMASITEIGKGRAVGWMRSIDASGVYDAGGSHRPSAVGSPERMDDRLDADALGQLRQLKSDIDQQSRELLSTGAGLAEYHEAMVQLRHRLDPFLIRRDECGRLARELLSVIDRVKAQPERSGAADRQIRSADDRFVQSLSTQFTGLTATELKICTLLRANLSSKEIAAVLSLSAYTVDTHRKRIRRKCGLSRNDNLQSFLLSFG